MPRSSPAWMVLLSVAATAYGQSGVPPDAAAPLNGGASPTKPAANGNGNGNGNGLRLALPPVVWTGSLGFDLSYSRFEGSLAGQPSTQQSKIVTASVGATTYIYAPWAALLSGNLNLSKEVTEYGDFGTSAQNSDFTTGSLRLNAFPYSRFPSELRYDVSDTRLDSTLGGGTHYRSSVIGVNQQYQPVDNAFTFRGNYERRVQEGLSFGRDTQDYLLLDYATAWKRQQLSSTFSHARNRAEATGEETDFTSLFARHTYAQDQSFSIDSGVSWTHADDQLLRGNRVITTAQLASIAIWNSQTLPLTVTGSARAASSQQDDAQAVWGLAAGVGASYSLTRNFQIAGSLIATRIDDRTTVGNVGMLTGNFQGDTVKLGPFDWNWYAGGGLGRQRLESVTDASLSGQIGQTLARSWVADRSTWSAALGQTFSAALQRRSTPLDLPLLEADRVSRAVTNTLSLGWSRPAGVGSATVQLNLSDARQLDREESRFQQANVQISGNYELSRYSRWTAGFSAQYTTQSNLVLQRGDGRPFIHRVDQDYQSANGDLAWYHDRLFDVPRLRFSSRLRVSVDAQSQSSLLVPLPDRELSSWENRLDYRVGKLDSSMALRFSRVDNTRQAFALWRLQRTF